MPSQEPIVSHALHLALPSSDALRVHRELPGRDLTRHFLRVTLLHQLRHREPCELLCEEFIRPVKLIYQILNFSYSPLFSSI